MSCFRGDFAATPKMHFKLCYLEAICVEERFDQPGYQIYCKLETLLLKACMHAGRVVEVVCTDDFEKDLLRSQLQTFAVHFQEFMVKNQLQQ